MDKNEAVRVVNEFAKALEKRGMNIAKVVLFGSYAAETHHEGSDIDIVVVSDDFAGRDREARFEMMIDALYEIWKPIEPRALTVDEWERGDSTIVEYAKNGENICGARGR